MRKFFQYINKQPKTVRDNYALAIATFFTALVLAVWVVARPGGEILVSDNVTADNSSSPFSTLLKGTKEKFSKMSNSLPQTESNDSPQAAAVINSSSTKPEELILSDEDIEIARQNIEESSSDENYQIEKRNFTEVMIATSSASTTTLPACTDIVINSASSGIGVSCLGSAKATSTSAQ